MAYLAVILSGHDDVIKWKQFPLYWLFVRGIHRSPVNSPHKGQWRGALMLSLICAWINGWVNNRETSWLIWDAIAPIMTSQWCYQHIPFLAPRPENSRQTSLGKHLHGRWPCLFRYHTTVETKLSKFCEQPFPNVFPFKRVMGVGFQFNWKLFLTIKWY